jgi:hypothetical protein
MVNAMAELSQISKRFYANGTTNQLLEHEGWSFLLLRGNYRKYKSHRACWQTFLHRIDKIHQSAVASGLLLYRQQEPNSSRRNGQNVLDAGPRQSVTNEGDGTQEENSCLPREFGPISETTVYNKHMVQKILESHLKQPQPIVIVTKN